MYPLNPQAPPSHPSLFSPIHNERIKSPLQSEIPNLASTNPNINQTYEDEVSQIQKYWKSIVLINDSSRLLEKLNEHKNNLDTLINKTNQGLTHSRRSIITDTIAQYGSLDILITAIDTEVHTTEEFLLTPPFIHNPHFIEIIDFFHSKNNLLELRLNRILINFFTLTTAAFYEWDNSQNNNKVNYIKYLLKLGANPNQIVNISSVSFFGISTVSMLADQIIFLEKKHNPNTVEKIEFLKKAQNIFEQYKTLLAQGTPVKEMEILQGSYLINKQLIKNANDKN